MTRFDTKRLPAEKDEVAPDGSEVRVLLGLAGGLMAHYTLDAGNVSTALTDRTVEEIWFFLSGCGEMWRKQGELEEIVPIESGVCVNSIRNALSVSFVWDGTAGSRGRDVASLAWYGRSNLGSGEMEANSSLNFTFLLFET